MPASVPGAVPHSSSAGTFCVLLAAILFSAKAILIKLAYVYPVDAATLLTLRLLFSAPFFVLMALWSKRAAVPLTRRQWLGFKFFYPVNCLQQQPSSSDVFITEHLRHSLVGFGFRQFRNSITNGHQYLRQ